MRRLLALSLLICSLGCAGLVAPVALAAGSGSASSANEPQPSFGLSNAEQGAVTQSTPQVVSVPASDTTTTSSGGLSGADALIIAIVAALLLGGIAFWVWYDSRGRVAHLRHGTQEDPMFARAHAGSKAPQKSRKLKPAERKRRKRGRAR
jgi:hypothetical protein